MLEIIPRHRKFNFSKYFQYTSILSIALVLGSLALIFLGRGLNYGVDFRGGGEIQVGFNNAVDLGQLRAVLEEGGSLGPACRLSARPATTTT